ncbi:MAG: hypothetical protein ABH886_01855 [Candidatus Desantisbacteria bacterium]
MMKRIATVFLCFMAMTGCAFGADIDTDGFEEMNSLSNWTIFPSASELGVDSYSPGYLSDYCIKISGDGLTPSQAEGYISSLPWTSGGYLSIEKPSDWERESVYTLRCMIRATNNDSSKAYLECDDPDGDVVLNKTPSFTPPSEWTECILNGYIKNSPMTTIKLGYEAGSPSGTGSGTVYIDDVSFYNSNCYLQSNTPLVFYINDPDDATITVTINRLQGATASTTPMVSVSDPFGNIKLSKTCEPGNQSYSLIIPPDNIKGDYRIEIPQDSSSAWRVSAKNVILDSKEVSIVSKEGILYFAVSDQATFTLKLNDNAGGSATLYNPNGLAVKKITWTAGSGEQHNLIMDGPVTGGVWAVGFRGSTSGDSQGNILVSSDGIPPYFSFTRDSYFLPAAWRYPAESFQVIANQAKTITTKDEKITISIPTSGISQNGTISIRKIDAPVIPLGYLLASSVYNIELRGTISLLQPSKSIPLTFRYDDASLSSVAEKSLAVFYYGTSTSNTNTATWIPLPTVERSITNNLIRVNVPRFAPLAILASPSWQARLFVETTEGVKDDGNYFGLDPGAKNTYDDPFDLEEEPSTPKPCVSLYTTAPNGTKFTRDIRALKDLSLGVEEWAFNVNTDVLLRNGAQVTITWDISNIPSNYPISLVEINSQQINLREIKAYSFVAPNGIGTRKFILRIGGEKEGTTTVSRTFSTDWNLCSIPLLLINPDPEVVFPGGSGQSGRISRFIDGRYVAYEQGGNFGTISPGIGYWFKINSTLTTNFVGYAVRNGTNSIPVSSGWNLIGNPFTFGVNWNNILFSHGTATERIADGKTINDGFYRYEADKSGKIGYFMDRYKDNSVMWPWKGYWIYSPMAGDLKIPAISSQPLAGAPELLQSQRDWEIKLSVSTDKSMDQDNYLGVADDASDGRNKYYIFEPPDGCSPFVSLYFPINDRDISGNFACVYKSPLIPNSPKVWDFEVLADGMQNATVTLQWQGMSDGCSLYLVDSLFDKKVDMKQFSSYAYNNGYEKIRKFQVVAALTASEIRVANGQIYAWPNPLTVNGVPPEEFTFAGILPNSVIKVYTLAGELIATRDKGMWDAKNDDDRVVASGVYFFVVENEGSVRKTGKLAVIR